MVFFSLKSGNKMFNQKKKNSFQVLIMSGRKHKSQSQGIKAKHTLKKVNIWEMCELNILAHLL